jgi:hypothetical protein
MSSDKTIYDELIPFFGNAKDQRVRLYLHTFLHDNLDTQSCRFLQHSNIWDDKGGDLADPAGGLVLKLDHTLNPDNKTTNNNINSIDPEWVMFFYDVGNRLIEDGSTMSSIPGRGRVPAGTGKTFSEGSEPVKVLQNLIKGGVSFKYGSTDKRKVLTFLNQFIDLVNGVRPRDLLTLPEIKSIKFLDVDYLVNLFLRQVNECSFTNETRPRLGFTQAQFEFVVAHLPYQKYKGRETFTYKLGKDVALAVLTETKEENITVSPSGSKFLDSLEMDSTALTYEYYRKPSDPSKLYTKDKDGKEIEVQGNSDKFWDEAKKDDNCYGFHVAKGDRAKCSDYLIDCIKGSDPTKCREYMTDAGFWGDAKGAPKEVKEMLPVFVIATLKKFGFETVKVFDSVAKRTINKIERVNTWLERLGKEMVKNDKEKDDFKNIMKNTNLSLYLDLLVAKLDASPHILNENFNGTSEETSVYNPNRFAGTTLAQYGLKPKLPNNIGCGNYAEKNRRLSDVLKYHIESKRTLPHFILPIAVRGSMRGGAVMNEEYKYSSNVLEDQYKLYVNILKSHGKEIAPDQDATLKNLLKSLRNTENKLVQSIKLFEKYVELMDVHKFNDPDTVLSLDGLDAIVKSNNKLLEKTNSKQESVLTVFQTLASVAQELTNILQEKFPSKAVTPSEVVGRNKSTWPKHV